jgi:hypothetical protein
VAWPIGRMVVIRFGVLEVKMQMSAERGSTKVKPYNNW